MILADTLRLLITITVCCCITGLLMWLFLLYNKKASIKVLLLCSSLLLVRFLYPYEFPFTHSVYITKGYPTLNEFLTKLSLSAGLNFLWQHFCLVYGSPEAFGTVSVSCAII